MALPAFQAGAVDLYWDADANPAGNNTTTGANLGGTGTWGAASNWFNGGSDVAWAPGSGAVFTGAAGTVTLASPQSASAVTFKSNGYTLTGSTLTVGPSPANYIVDAGVTATIASTLAGGATLTKTGPGTLILSNTANVNTANTVEGGWRIDGGILRIAADQSLGAPLPDAARNTVTDIQLNQATLQFGGSFEIDINRRTKVNTNSSTQNLGDAVIDVVQHDVSWFGSIQGGLGSLRVTGNGNGGKLVLGTDKKASVNPFGSALPGGTVNLTVENHVVVQTSGQVTPTGGELGSETGAGGAVLAIKLQTGGQIRAESGDYTFQRNLILGPGGGSLDTGAWIQHFSGGTISGPGSLTKFGSSTLILDNASATWAGGTTVNGGTLQLGVGGSNGLLPGVLGSPSSVVVNAGATLKFLRGSNKSFFDNISGDGAVVIANVNNATVRLVSDNTYTGGTTISSGTLMIGQGNPNQPGSIVGNVTNNSALVFNKVEDLAYGGSISGTGTVTKQAAGKLMLTGSSTYTGATNVIAGTLIAANTTGSATGSGPVNVSSGATLAGNGFIQGTVTLNAGAHLAPGASAGMLSVSSLALAANSVLDFELGLPASSDRTIISTPGGLNLTGGIVNVTALAGFGVGQYPLLDYAGSFTGAATNLSIGSAPGGFGYAFVNNPANTSIDLVVTPEPSALLMGFTIIPLFCRRRRIRGA
jgi:autotransporter-associated beta strand protein